MNIGMALILALWAYICVFDMLAQTCLCLLDP